MPAEMETMAKRLKLYREAVKQSQLEASEEIGISVEELGRLEKGGANPRYDTLPKVSKYMGVDVPTLLAEERVQTSVYCLLNGLGVTPKYIGYFQTAQSVELCVESPEKLTQMTKLVYAEVGKRYHANWTTVERNIRTVAKTAYKHKPRAVERLMGYELYAHPKSSEFIASLTARVLSGNTDLYE